MTVRRKDPIKSKFKPDTTRRKDPIKSKFKGPKKSLKKLPSGKAIVRTKKKVDSRSSAAKKVGKKESLLSKHVKRLKKDGTGKSSLRELKIAAKKHGIDLTGL